MKIYDLSLTISDKMTALPQLKKPLVKIKKIPKDNCFISQISLLSRHGTHLIAPRQFFKAGKTLEKIDLEKIVGRCKVINLTNFFKVGGPAEVGWAHFEQAKVRKGDRLLLKTGNFKYLANQKITNDYISLSADAAKNLAKREISLIGVDYFKIEKKDNKENSVYKTLLKAEIVILEGLNLKDVPQGEYLLVCAPLKIRGADGSPARVFLIKE